MTISIDKGSCIKCGKCAQVCPAGIMIQDKTTKEINLEHIDDCIACGHCVDVCPTGSVIHSEFPAEKVHTIDYSQLPTAEQVMLLIKSRRSNRTITSKPIPKELLERIVEAAYYAPTASNARQVSFKIITDPEKLRQISDFTVGVFDSLRKKLMNPIIKTFLKPFLPEIYKLVPKFEQLKQHHLAGNDPILRKATALLIIHTPESNRFGCEDSNLAYQNASLMAQASGVSQIYMGFILTAIKQDKKDTFNRITGIKGRPQAIMALGMPAFKYPKYADRLPGKTID